MRDAMQYLRETQEDDGSWYGRWGVNYIYGTWQVLRGLRAIGEDMTQDWIVRGRDWLESCQNDDGGWGETLRHLRRSVAQRQGRKHGFADGLGADGICACGDLDRPSVQRGLRYLISTQQKRWLVGEAEITGTGFPRVFYLKYDMYRQNFPLLALATYVNYRSGSGIRRASIAAGCSRAAARRAGPSRRAAPLRVSQRRGYGQSGATLTPRQSRRKVSAWLTNYRNYPTHTTRSNLISTRARMEIHHTKHHQTYITNVNNALKDHPDLAKKSVEDLIKDLNAVPEAIRTAVERWRRACAGTNCSCARRRPRPPASSSRGRGAGGTSPGRRPLPSTSSIRRRGAGWPCRGPGFAFNGENHPGAPS